MDEPRVTEVMFDHGKCVSLDLCASAVMDAMFLQGSQRAQRRSRSLTACGNFSDVDDVNVLLKSCGILKNLRHPASTAIPPGLLGRLRVFPLRNGKKTPAAVSSDAELTSTGLVNFFNSCLGMEGFRLRDGKARSLIDLISEVLLNAQEHSGLEDRDGSPVWYAIGYHRTSETPGMGGECHIVLFNFGFSIFESLARPDTSEELKSQIRALAAEHTKRGFFNRLGDFVWEGVTLQKRRIWQEDALWTLYALQEGVSRFRGQPDGQDRGNGTVHVIEFFADLASGAPKMVLVSGRTWILFDGTHRLSTIMKDGGSRKVIAFNSSNDLMDPPDHNFVRTLDREFPGTLVSLRFGLRSEDLAKMQAEVAEND